MYARYQTALAELTAAVLAHGQPADVMAQAAALVAQTLAVAYSAVWELLPDQGILKLRASSGWPKALAATATLAADSTSVVGAAMHDAVPIHVADWTGETRFQQPAPLRDAGIVSSLAVTIPGPSGLFGGLSVDVTA
ncbi:MAG TPA: GAF domain-containing protein, partial [Roseiflexaceae bacterium]|nr:GAF domain-containing protein [Roseiflexaceae bacterium]